jgi:hypothetical protein
VWNVFNYLWRATNGRIIAYKPAVKEEPSPMWIRASNKSVQLNWTAIFSYTAALGISLAIWRELFRAVQFLVR